jgi:hypothetical protein
MKWFCFEVAERVQCDSERGFGIFLEAIGRYGRLKLRMNHQVAQRHRRAHHGQEPVHRCGGIRRVDPGDARAIRKLVDERPCLRRGICVEVSAHERLLGLRADGRPRAASLDIAHAAPARTTPSLAEPGAALAL